VKKQQREAVARAPFSDLNSAPVRDHHGCIATRRVTRPSRLVRVGHRPIQPGPRSARE
jgi:hypothetical protein